MEADRYNQNHKLYFVGMACILMSMGFLLFFLYTFPHLVMGWRYDVPEFLAFWRQQLVVDFGVAEHNASLSISFTFLFFAILFGIGAYYASTSIDNEIYHIAKKRRNLYFSDGFKDSLYFLMNVIGAIALVLGVIFCLYWLIYTTPPTL